MSTEYLNRFVELETTSGICTPNWIQTSKATLSDAPDKHEEIWRKKTTGFLRNLFINLNKSLEVNSFIEIGAHEASISIELKKLEIGNVYAFEANPFVYKKYASNLKELNISYENIAISEINGKVKISIPRFSEDLARPDSSLLKRSAEASYEEIEIESKTLDKVIIDNSLKGISLWIDTEGLTLNVLQSAGKEIEKVNLMLVEVEDINYWKNQGSAVDVFKYCYENNFVAVARDMDGRGQYNVIFVRDYEIAKIGGLISDYYKDLSKLKSESDTTKVSLNRFTLK